MSFNFSYSPFLHLFVLQPVISLALSPSSKSVFPAVFSHAIYLYIEFFFKSFLFLLFFNFFHILFLFLFLFFIQLQLSAFSPHPSTPPQLNPPPSPTSTLPRDFVLVSFIVAPIDPSPHYPLPTSLWLLLHCS